MVDFRPRIPHFITTTLTILLADGQIKSFEEASYFIEGGILFVRTHDKNLVFNRHTWVSVEQNKQAL